jgi:hypothetical protein
MWREVFCAEIWFWCGDLVDMTIMILRESDLTKPLFDLSCLNGGTINRFSFDMKLRNPPICSKGIPNYSTPNAQIHQRNNKRIT